MTNKNPIQLIDIGIKTPGNPAKVAIAALDPLQVDPKDYKLEFENRQVRSPASDRSAAERADARVCPQTTRWFTSRTRMSARPRPKERPR